jgi:hypothetical protein
MAKRSSVAVFIFLLAFTVYSFFQFPGFQGYEDETYNRVVENLAKGEFKTVRSGYAQIVLETPFVFFGWKLGEVLGIGVNQATHLFANFYNPFISAVTAAIFFLIAGLFTNLRRAFWAALAFAFLTMAFPYAGIGMEPTGLFFLLTSTYFLLRFGKYKDNWNLILSGALYFLLLFSKAYYFVTFPAFLVYLGLLQVTCLPARQAGYKLQATKNFIKQCVMFFLPLIIIFPVYLLANKYNFGVYFGGAYNLRVELLGGDNILFGFYGLLLSFGKSIFIYNPILILGLFFLKRFYNQHKKEAVFLVLFSLCLLLFVSWMHWWSDETWGPRYLLAFIFPPTLLLAAAKRQDFRFSGAKKTAFAVFTSFIVAWSLFMQLLGTLSRYDVFPYTFSEIHAKTGYNVVASQEYQYIPQFAPYLVNYQLIKNKILSRNDPLRYRMLYTPPMELAAKEKGREVTKEIAYDNNKYQAHVLNFWWQNVPRIPPYYFLVLYGAIFMGLFWWGRKLLKSDVDE